MIRGTLTTLSLAAYAVLAGAVIICVGLTGSALMQANDRIGAIDTALTSVKGHADPLTYQVTKVNDSLTAIEQSLAPLHSQADTLNGMLSQVQQTLGTANGTVGSVSGLAINAEGSLAPADQDLAATDVSLGQNGHTDTNVGTITSQAAAALAILGPVQNDLSTI
ncbi:MAG: DUF948 domain-containing protein, partial [Candidatus Dormibacteria bacterium]